MGTYTDEQKTAVADFRKGVEEMARERGYGSEAATILNAVEENLFDDHPAKEAANAYVADTAYFSSTSKSSLVTAFKAGYDHATAPVSEATLTH